jgi:hypothetical protein
MDLKNGMKNLKENITLRHILEVLLAVGNFLNGAEVNKILLFGLIVFKSLILVNRFST